MKKITPFTETLSNGSSFEMILVEGGLLKIVGNEEETDVYNRAICKIFLKAFYIGKYPVTNSLWKAVMEKKQSKFKGANHPVERVSWEESQRFLARLNEITGKSYRLPSEAEWEYAARGGHQSEDYIYAGSDRLAEVGWYARNSGGQTHPVGEKLSNELGIFDMSGNVSEWVEDQMHISFEGIPSDGSAWVDRSFDAERIHRGGSWRDKNLICKVSSSEFSKPEDRFEDLGFRIAISP